VAICDRWVPAKQFWVRFGIPARYYHSSRKGYNSVPNLRPVRLIGFIYAKLSTAQTHSIAQTNSKCFCFLLSKMCNRLQSNSDSSKLLGQSFCEYWFIKRCRPIFIWTEAGQTMRYRLHYKPKSNIVVTRSYQRTHTSAQFWGLLHGRQISIKDQ